MQSNEHVGAIIYKGKWYKVTLCECINDSSNDIYEPSTFNNGIIKLQNGHHIQIRDDNLNEKYSDEFKSWFSNFMQEQKQLFTSSNRLKNNYRRYTVRPWDEIKCKYYGIIKYCIGPDGCLADLLMKNNM